MILIIFIFDEFNEDHQQVPYHKEWEAQEQSQRAANIPHQIDKSVETDFSFNSNTCWCQGN